MTEPTPMNISYSPHTRLIPTRCPASDPLYSVLQRLTCNNMVPILEELVAPAVSEISAADIVQLRNGRFGLSREAIARIVIAFLVLRMSQFVPSSQVLTLNAGDLIFYGVQDESTPLLSDEAIIDVLFEASDDNIIARRQAYRCLTYIPMFLDTSWVNYADAQAHLRTNRFYLNRMMEILVGIVRATEDNGTAARWNYGVTEGWTSLDFLAAVSPGLILFLDALRRMSGNILHPEDSPPRGDRRGSPEPDVGAIYEEYIVRQDNSTDPPRIITDIYISQTPRLRIIPLPPVPPNSPTPSSASSNTSSVYVNNSATSSEVDLLDPMYRHPGESRRPGSSIESSLFLSSWREDEDERSLKTESDSDSLSFEHLADSTAGLSIGPEDNHSDIEMEPRDFDIFDSPFSEHSALLSQSETLSHEELCDGIIAPTMEVPNPYHYQTPNSSTESFQDKPLVNSSEDEVVLAMNRAEEDLMVVHNFILGAGKILRTTQSSQFLKPSSPVGKICTWTFPGHPCNQGGSGLKVRYTRFSTGLSQGWASTRMVPVIDKFLIKVALETLIRLPRQRRDHVHLPYMLQSLIFGYNLEDEWDVNVDVFQPTTAPVLQTLEVTAAAPWRALEHVRLPWSQLTSIVSFPAFDAHALTRLRTLTNLEELQVDVHASGVHTPIQDIVPLPKLRRLYVDEESNAAGRSAEFLTTLRVPALSELFLDFPCDSVTHFPTSPLSFGNLTKLTLSCAMDSHGENTRHLLNFLSLTQHVECLHLHYSSMTVEFFEGLELKDGSPLRLPCLRSLDIGSCHAPTLPDNLCALVDMLYSRLPDGGQDAHGSGQGSGSRVFLNNVQLPRPVYLRLELEKPDLFSELRKRKCFLFTGCI
ncbi:hypothetical protein BDZ89DRAFT_1229035 [Hymenopellis radicata]|nr:hypothetical protein BDZ89DRAFT_1229035 [Hymenopellis radicata]